MATRLSVLHRRRKRAAQRPPQQYWRNCGDWVDDYDDDYDFDDDDCAFCGGDGWVDGYESDPLWFEPGELELCSSCGGSGRAKNQTIW